MAGASPYDISLERIVALESENAALRADLERLRHAEPYEGLSAKYHDVLRKFEGLQKAHAACRPYVEKATKRYESAKNIAKQWQRYIDQQRQKQSEKHAPASKGNTKTSTAEAGLPDADLDRTPKPGTRRDGGDEDAYHPPMHASLDHAFRREEDAEDPVEAHQVAGDRTAPPTSETLDHDRMHRDEVELPMVLPPCQAPARATDGPVETQHAGSSQSTECGSDPLPSEKACAGSDDEPQVVMARSVKRKRGTSPLQTEPPTKIKLEHASPSQPMELCSEDYSSPILQGRDLMRTETSDLNAVMRPPEPPINRRRLRALSAETQAPPRLPATTSSLSESDPRELKQRPVKDEPVLSPNETSFNAVAENGNAVNSRHGNDLSDRALQPLSANLPSMEMLSTKLAGSKRRRRNSDMKAKAAILSEDGDMYSSQVQSHHHKEMPKSAVGRRLDSLLEEPTPNRAEVPKRRALAAKKLHSGEEVVTPLANNSNPARKRLPTPPTTIKPLRAQPRSPQRISPAKRRPLGIGKSPPPPDPNDEPLRGRPISSLRIEDFKINPTYMGADFAFADTLRGRDQRRCLPGCTKPECCGTNFRKAVEMGVRSKCSDAQALQAYLGPDYKSVMSTFAPDKRNDVLLRAHTAALAKEHGKHRNAFERRTSPPGYWRVDMPSTQEFEQDRAKAQELTHERVEERWREALIEGGRWKFRDE